MNELVPMYSPNYKSNFDFDTEKFVEDLWSGNVEQFMLRLHSYLSGIQFDLKNKTEKHFQTVFYLLFSLMGQFVKTKEHTSAGIYEIGNRKIIKIGTVIDLTKRIVGKWKMK